MQVRELRMLLGALQPDDFIFIETEKGKARFASFVDWDRSMHGNLCGLVLRARPEFKKETSVLASAGENIKAGDAVVLKSTLTRATPEPSRHAYPLGYQSYSYRTLCPATYGIELNTSNVSPDPTGVVYDMHWDTHGISVLCRMEVVYEPYYRDQHMNRGGGPGTPNTDVMSISFFKHQTHWAKSRLNRKLWDNVMKFTWRELALVIANRLHESLPAFQAGRGREHLDLKLALCFLGTVEQIEAGKSPFHIILWNKWEDRVVVMVGAMLVESSKDDKFYNIERCNWEDTSPLSLNGVDGPRAEYFKKLENTRQIGHKLVEMRLGNETGIQTWMGDGIGVGKPRENV